VAPIVPPTTCPVEPPPAGGVLAAVSNERL